MLNGFLPFSRASMMLDVVSLAMLIIVPVMFWSIYCVKQNHQYALHKKVQLTLGGVLLIAVTLFEVDIRVFGWRHLAKNSPYFSTILFPVLYVHLFFAISTTLLWVFVTVNALRRFPSPPKPNEYSPKHKRLAWLAAIDMACTSVTGWSFYYLAFVA